MSLFGTSGIRGPVNDLVSADLALDLGRGVASNGWTRVTVGRDHRKTSEWLVDALVAGARECGADVVDLGLVSTPTLARSVDWYDGDVGVMVTASHNPPEDNGFKLWARDGQAIESSNLRSLITSAKAGLHEPVGWDETGARETVDDAVDRHVASIVDDAPELEGLSVVVDVGNGTGGVTVRTLEELGADVVGLHDEPDGRFPNRPSEPGPEACSKLREVVSSTDADLGVAHDGDADRMLAVTESGEFVSGDLLLAIFARAEATEGDRIAAPINTSLAVDDALESLGASVTRTPIGDVHVANRARESDVVFGGEPSGAWIWPDVAMCPDGSLAACRLAALVRERGSLDALAEEIETYPLRRRSLETESKSAVMDGIRRAVTNRYPDASTTMDGVHVAFDDGWFLIRASGTEPLVRLTAEAETERRADELLDAAEGFARIDLPQ